MINKKIIFDIIDIYFKNRKNKFEKSQFEDISILIEEGILNPISDKAIEINIKSNEFNEIFVEYIENNQRRRMPQSVKESFHLIDEFEQQKKKEFEYDNIINAYSEIINALKSYIFYSFHSKGIINICDFFKTLGTEDKYDEYLLESLLLIDIDHENIYRILSLLKSNNEITRIPEFCSRLGKTKPILALNLYDYSLQMNDKNDLYILSNILMGLFEINPQKAFFKTKELLKTNPVAAYFTLGRLKYKQKEYIQECFELADNIGETDNECILQIPYIYKALIENSITPEDTREKCFSKKQNLFLIDNKQLKNCIFNDCRFIHGYEEERYKLLIETFLSKSQDYYNRISDYFYNFTNPDYFFHVFSMLYDIQYRNRGLITDIRVFSKALSHFWKVDKEKTEKHLLNLISHDIPHFRIGAVDLVQSKDFKFYDINLLNLDTPIKQLRALEALFFQSFYNIDKFLPLILKLKDSSHKIVITYIQQKISELIMNSYHEHIYKEVAKYINDDDFMKPLKATLDSYYKMRDVKISINDLNPRKNEYDLMNLYFTLEQEEQHKMMHKINNSENSFLSMVKQTTIVRGHSWKIRDNDISPLGNIKYSFALDLNMYRNPDLFDYSHSTFNSEF